MDNVEKLYQNYDILADAETKGKAADFEQKYLEILEAVKGSSNEKRLASQFISRFFKNYPHLSDKSIDAQLDLCEDDDVAIRKQAIKDLPSFCKDRKEYVPKIADVLAQLLATDDSTELSVVHQSLMSLFNVDAKDTFGGLFSQINAGEEIVRERAINFLGGKVKSLPGDVLTRDVEDYLFQECKKVFEDITGEEFVTVMGMLSGLKMAKTVGGQQLLVEMIAEQASFEKDFDRGDTDSVDRLVQCIRQARPYFSPFVSSGQFVHYVCFQVLPVLSELPPLQEGVDVALEILKLLAEMSPFANNMEDTPKCLEMVYKRLLEYMPLPPSDETIEKSTEEPSLQLSHVECLMFAFHQLAKRYPEFLTAEENAERLRDLKLRLQYLARGIQGYIKKLKEALHGKVGSELKTEENKIKVVALRTTSNINTLIKDLFHNPPSYKSTITLSWKPPSSSSGGINISDTLKRKNKTPITYDESAEIKKTKGERELYSPPSGKYSTNVKFPSPNRGRGYGYRRGRGRY
ncbi:apoptosis inhibitor 5 [Centruroides vittatus]|uniref:apoptosis inhibitor 5 n=1 Tax=Centruroides vittatus TaxID=120091 RepID=UPI0035106DCA